MDTVKSILPQEQGLLPKWLLLVSLVAALNSVQAYTTLTLTRRVYSSPTATSQITPLSTRTFGTWTFTSAIVRLYAAYNITNEPVYTLCFWTYAIAWTHFMSEWVGFRTARWGKGLAGPVFVSTGSLVWMWMQWGYYVN